MKLDILGHFTENGTHTFKTMRFHNGCQVPAK